MVEVIKDFDLYYYTTNLEAPNCMEWYTSGYFDNIYSLKKEVFKKYNLKISLNKTKPAFLWKKNFLFIYLNKMNTKEYKQKLMINKIINFWLKLI